MSKFLRKDQIALQLFQVRKNFRDLKNIPETFKKIRATGCTAVETVGFFKVMGYDFPSCSELSSMLEDSGLKCCSHHELFDSIKNNPDKIIDDINKLGCKYIVSAVPATIDFENLDDIKKLAKSLNELGKLFKDAGIKLLYHNHNMEFVKLDKKTTCLEFIYNETNPEYLQSQLDIYWIQLGGGNPESWCRKMKGRMPSLHVNDFKVIGGTRENPIKEPTSTELGEGNLEIKPIMEAANESGCGWYIIEVHDNYIDSDPIKSFKLSYSYLLENFCLE